MIKFCCVSWWLLNLRALDWNHWVYFWVFFSFFNHFLIEFFLQAAHVTDTIAFFIQPWRTLLLSFDFPPILSNETTRLLNQMTQFLLIQTGMNVDERQRNFYLSCWEWLDWRSDINFLTNMTQGRGRKTRKGHAILCLRQKYKERGLKWQFSSSGYVMTSETKKTNHKRQRRKKKCLSFVIFILLWWCLRKKKNNIES